MASLHPELLAILACPAGGCHGPLTQTEAALLCGRCGRSYRIEQSWPVLIPDEATPPDPAARPAALRSKSSPPARDSGAASAGGAT
ncbi:MAG: Trm112 family protein [Phycisphaerae bacterium]